jgi:hypothetical protein
MARSRWRNVTKMPGMFGANPSAVRRLRKDGTPEFEGLVVGAMNLVCRRTSSRTNLARWSESCLEPERVDWLPWR